MKYNEEVLVSYGLLFGLCCVISMVCIFWKKKSRLLTFFLQGILSVGLLVGMNKGILSKNLMFPTVPITPVHVGTCFLLGLPGIGLLYGIVLFERYY